jgi:phospholipase/carboxylesterase
MRTFARALEKLYPLHRLPPVGRYFCEEPFHERLAELDPDPPRAERVGLHATGDPKQPGERGGFCLYVPEHYDESRTWPLVVCLHGGSGSGREYLWLWLREARGRGFLVLAPTSIGPTWSMIGPDVDRAAIAAMVEYVASNWAVDRARILLSGLSDGATYGLMLALDGESPFSAIAPIAGVLHPALVRDGRWAAGKRIYLVHGALDWMFPVAQARWAHEQLVGAGADVVYREIEDLSHTYPREENDRILGWFDPALALPQRSA